MTMEVNSEMVSGWAFLGLFTGIVAMSRSSMCAREVAIRTISASSSMPGDRVCMAAFDPLQLCLPSPSGTGRWSC